MINRQLVSKFTQNVWLVYLCSRMYIYAVCPNINAIQKVMIFEIYKSYLQYRNNYSNKVQKSILQCYDPRIEFTQQFSTDTHQTNKRTLNFIYFYTSNSTPVLSTMKTKPQHGLFGDDSTSSLQQF